MDIDLRDLYLVARAWRPMTMQCVCVCVCAPTCKQATALMESCHHLHCRITAAAISSKSAAEWTTRPNLLFDFFEFIVF